MQILLLTSILFAIAFSQTCMIAGCDKSLQSQSATGTDFKCFSYNQGVSLASAKCPNSSMICSTYNDYLSFPNVPTSGNCVSMNGLPKQQFLDQLLRVPGDFCSNTTDCVLGSTCIGNVCVAPERISCVDPNQCSAGNYCSLTT